jgi:hypothetical protein
MPSQKISDEKAKQTPQLLALACFRAAGAPEGAVSSAPGSHPGRLRPPDPRILPWTTVAARTCCEANKTRLIRKTTTKVHFFSFLYQSHRMLFLQTAQPPHLQVDSSVYNAVHDLFSVSLCLVLHKRALLPLVRPLKRPEQFASLHVLRQQLVQRKNDVRSKHLSLKTRNNPDNYTIVLVTLLPVKSIISEEFISPQPMSSPVALRRKTLA